MSAAISAHRLLGDGQSLALVTPDGVVDWWCAPRLDAPPLLWSLLDPHGSESAWIGGLMVEDTGPTAGPVCEGILRTDDGRLRRRDGMVTIDGASCLVRLVRAERGEFEIAHRLSVGGFDGARREPDEDGFATIDTVDIGVVADGSSVRSGFELRTTFTLRPDRWTGLVVSVNAPRPIGVEEATAELDAAEQRASKRLVRSYLPKHHPDRALDALTVLETCTFGATGAVVAAATTSLPEAPGHDRQFDYRYSWLRDAALATSVASLLGHGDSACQHLAFVRSIAGPDGRLDDPVVTVDGGRVPDEREVAGVAGWEGSLPVRVGNGAAGQVQYDAWGIVTEAVSVHLQTGGRLDDDTWNLVRALADRVTSEAVAPSHGIWELREAADLVSGEIGRWLVLDRAIWIARGWRPTAHRRHWKRARRKIRARVLDAIDDDGGLPQVFGGPSRADASSLMVVLFGMLAPDDPRARRLVEATVRALEAGPFLYRYPPGGDDGFEGREATFLPMAWWAAACFAVVGRVDEARRRVDELCARLPPLLSEEVAADDGRSLGNVPLVWSHMELARTLYILDAAEIRQRFHAPGLWLWRVMRYASLRRQTNHERRLRRRT